MRKQVSGLFLDRLDQEIERSRRGRRRTEQNPRKRRGRCKSTDDFENGCVDGDTIKHVEKTVVLEIRANEGRKKGAER